MGIPTRKHQLSCAEKVLVIKAHEYFLREKAEGRAGSQRDTRERVADCTGFSASTMGKVIADWRLHQDPSFPPRDTDGVPLGPKEKPIRGHRPRLDETTIAEDIRTIIADKNAKSQPVTAAIVRAALQE